MSKTESEKICTLTVSILPNWSFEYIWYPFIICQSFNCNSYTFVSPTFWTSGSESLLASNLQLRMSADARTLVSLTFRTFAFLCKWRPAGGQFGSASFPTSYSWAESHGPNSNFHIKKSSFVKWELLEEYCVCWDVVVRVEESHVIYTMFLYVCSANPKFYSISVYTILSIRFRCSLRHLMSQMLRGLSYGSSNIIAAFDTVWPPNRSQTSGCPFCNEQVSLSLWHGWRLRTSMQGWPQASALGDAGNDTVQRETHIWAVLASSSLCRISPLGLKYKTIFESRIRIVKKHKKCWYASNKIKVQCQFWISVVNKNTKNIDVKRDRFRGWGE